MTSRTLSGYEKETISKPLEQPAFADSKHDNGIVEVSGFFCHACLMDKPAPEASPDPRYCQGCYDFLLKEAEILRPGKRPEWVPRVQSKKDSTGKIGCQKPIQVSKDMVLNMHTVNDKKIEVCIIQPLVGKDTRKKRGPKYRELPEDLIRQWASKGTGSKAIATRLKRDFDIKVHYSTIQRLLVGQRVLSGRGEFERDDRL